MNIEDAINKFGLKIKVDANGKKVQKRIQIKDISEISFEIDEQTLYNCRRELRQRIDKIKDAIPKTLLIDNPYVVWSEKRNKYFVTDGNHLVWALKELKKEYVDCFIFDEDGDNIQTMLKSFLISFNLNVTSDMFTTEKIISIGSFDSYMKLKLGGKYGQENKLAKPLGLEIGLVKEYLQMYRGLLEHDLLERARTENWTAERIRNEINIGKNDRKEYEPKEKTDNEELVKIHTATIYNNLKNISDSNVSINIDSVIENCGKLIELHNKTGTKVSRNSLLGLLNVKAKVKIKVETLCDWIEKVEEISED